jgi:hypothetical protein
VLTVAIRANGRIRIALENCFPVYALIVDLRDVPVTLCTRMWNVEFVHKGGGIARLFHVVPTMAIAAHRGPHIALCQRDTMNTRLVRCNEACRRSNTLSHIRIVKMATQTHFGLVRFVHRRRLACDRLDVVLTMAIDACRRAFDVLR